jgi:hypothetical protein
MKSLILALILTSFGFAANAQTTKQQKSTALTNKVVEIACGECQFKLKGKSCDFVDGKSIDDFGDAHDEKHGFCNVISKAEVTGKIVKNRFQATDIKLLTDKK